MKPCRHTLSPKERRTIAAGVAAEALQRAAVLKGMAPEERARKLQAEAAEREERELEALRVDEAKTKLALEAIAGAFRGAKPRTNEELARHRWETVTCHDLAAVGLPERLRKRIIDWNQPKQEEAFRRVKGYLRGVGAVVALCGARGTGKSTLCAQIMRERVEARHAYAMADLVTRGPEPAAAGRYEKLVRLGGLFKPLFAGFGSTNADSLAGRYEAWVRLELLVIDEVHDGEAIVPAMTMLVDLVDRRYAERRDTILISNRDPEEFRDQMNPSIVSRIAEEGAIIRCDWPSWRTPR